MAENAVGTKPLDGSVMLLEREIGQIPYFANQQRSFTMKLQPNLIKKLTLHFHGELKTAVASNVFFNRDVGPYGIIRNVEVRASNGVILKAVDGKALHAMNTLEHASEEMVVNNNFNATDWKSFSFDLMIPFENHTGFLPERTVLNTNEFSEIALYIRWGEPRDFCITDQTDYVAEVRNFVCDIVALERIPLSMEDELLNRQRMVDTMQYKTVTTDNQIITFDLPENTLNKTLLFYLERKSQYVPEVGEPACYCRTFIHDGIVRARVEDNNGAHIIREMSGRQNQSIIRTYYHIGGLTPMPWEAAEAGDDEFPQKRGQYVFEFDQLHDFTSLYSTIGVNYPRLILETGILPDPETPQHQETFRVVLFQRQIITPASTTP